MLHGGELRRELDLLLGELLHFFFVPLLVIAEILLHACVLFFQRTVTIICNFQLVDKAAADIGMQRGGQVRLQLTNALVEEAGGVQVVSQTELLIQLRQELLLHIVEVREDVADIWVHVLLQLLGDGHLHQVLEEMVRHLLDLVDVLLLRDLLLAFEFGLQFLNVGGILRVRQLSDGFALVVVKALLVGLLQQLRELFLCHRQLIGYVLLHEALMECNGVPVRVIELSRLDILPGCLDDRHTASVDGLRVGLGELAELDASHELAVDLLRLDLPEDLPSKCSNLLDEFRSEALVVEIVEHLQLLLFLDGPDDCVAISILEEVSNQSSDSILLLDRIAHALLLLQRLLEIVLLSNAVSVLILKPEGEVTENPQEAGEVHRQLVRVEVLVSTLDLERLGEIDDKAQVVERILVDGAHAVVHEQGTHQERQQEDLRVVILLLVEGAEAFGVDDDDGKLLAILLGVEHFLPDPEAFGAGIDRRSYLEALESL